MVVCAAAFKEIVFFCEVEEELDLLGRVVGVINFDAVEEILFDAGSEEFFCALFGELENVSHEDEAACITDCVACLFQ